MQVSQAGGSYAIPIDSYAEPERMDSYAKPMDAAAAGCCCCRLLLGIRCCRLLAAAAGCCWLVLLLAADAAGCCCRLLAAAAAGCCCCSLLLLLLAATYLGDVAGTYRKPMQNLCKCYAKGVGIVRRNLGKRRNPRNVTISALKMLSKSIRRHLLGNAGAKSTKKGWSRAMFRTRKRGNPYSAGPL